MPPHGITCNHNTIPLYLKIEYRSEDITSFLFFSSVKYCLSVFRYWKRLTNGKSQISKLHLSQYLIGWLCLSATVHPSFPAGEQGELTPTDRKRKAHYRKTAARPAKETKSEIFDTRHLDRRTYSFKKKSRRQHGIREWRRERRDSTGRWRQAGARPVSLCSFGWTLVCYSVKH